MKKEQILFREGLIPCWCDKYPECPMQASQQTITERWLLRETKKQKTTEDLRKLFQPYQHRKKESFFNVVELNQHIRKVLGL